MTQAWDIDQSRQLQLPHPEHPEEGHTAQVYALQLHGSYLVSGSADRTIRIWDTDTQRLIRGPLVGHTKSVVCLQFDDHPEQDIIISGSVDGSIIVWQFSTGRLLKQLQNAHSETVLSLAFNEQFLVTGGKDAKVKLWNRRAIKDPGELPEYLRADINSSDGTGLAYSLSVELKEQHGPVNCVAIYDTSVLAGASCGTINVWDLRTGQVTHKITGLHEMGICDLEYDGHYITSASSDKTCRVYDLDRTAEVACLRGHTNMVRALCTTHDGDIVTAGYDGSIRYWKRLASEQWQCQTPLDCGEFRTGPGDNNNHAEQDLRRVLDIQLDSRRLFCAGEGPIIKIWDFSGASLSNRS